MSSPIDDTAARKAGRRAATPSPFEREAKTSPVVRLGYLALHGLVFYAGTQVGGWVGNVLIGWAIVAALLNLVLWPLHRKTQRRRMLLAREQVHRVRKLLDARQSRIGADSFFELSPETDPVSFYHGVAFALAKVEATLDDAEKETPEPRMWGTTLHDDGTTSRNGRK